MPETHKDRIFVVELIYCLVFKYLTANDFRDFPFGRCSMIFAECKDFLRMGVFGIVICCVM